MEHLLGRRRTEAEQAEADQEKEGAEQAEAEQEEEGAEQEEEEEGEQAEAEQEEEEEGEQAEAEDHSSNHPLCSLRTSGRWISPLGRHPPAFQSRSLTLMPERFLSPALQSAMTPPSASPRTTARRARYRRISRAA
jgi:hypothetical protein